MDSDVTDFNCVTFNQDSQCLAVGHKTGYSFYPLSKLGENCQPEHSSSLPDTHIVERLLSSGLAMVVSHQQPRTMHVCHVENRNTIHDQKFSSSILNVKINRQRVAVCLEESIHVYNLKDMRKLHTIDDTPPNKMGLIDLSEKQSILAYPGSCTTGKVHIFDAENLKSLHTFVAHESALACMRLDTNGTKLATASNKGTVIRVFSVKDGAPVARLFEFRRGVARSAIIYNLAFSMDASLLVSSSNTETVHIFKLSHDDQQKEQDQANGGWLGYLTSYIPGQMMEKSFATAHLPSPGKAYAVLPTLDKETQLVVATAEGYLFFYKIDKNGGECEMIRQRRIGPNADKLDSPSPIDGNSPPRDHCAA